MTDNLSIWNNLDKPPKEALKTIKGGRLQGKSDINPQWRLKAMTQQFGPCGIGWKYEIVKLWTEPGVDGEVFAFAQVNVYTRKETANSIEDPWNCPVPGIGGNMLIQMEKNGLYCNDEGFKMAITDALGTALKCLGVAAEVYLGNWDGAKYVNHNPAKKAVQCPKCKMSGWVIWQEETGTWRCQKDQGGCGSVWKPGKTPTETLVDQVAGQVAEATESKFATEEMIESLINIAALRGYSQTETERYLAQSFQWPAVPLSWENWKRAEKSALAWPKKAGKEPANAS